MFARRAFTLIELMIVIAIIAIIAAIMIPGLLRSKISTNESSAIATMRTMATAQTQFQQAAAVDCDGDGSGEFGYLAELAGFSGLRVNGSVSAVRFSPPGIPESLGLVQNGSSNKAGYEFRIYLPTATGPAVDETGGVPVGASANANNQEVRWCAYAWPAANNQSGTKAFFVNDNGEVLGTNNLAAGQGYNGKTVAPAPGAAFDTAGTNPGNLDAGAARVASMTAGDGGLWRPTG